MQLSPYRLLRNMPTEWVGRFALVVWLVWGSGCAMPSTKDRSLEEITQAKPDSPYPTAVSPSASRTISQPQSKPSAEVAVQQPAQSEKPATTEASAAAEQPYKSTPLQLPEAPAKTIPLSLKKDIPAPLPLAPHQRPLNFPLAVAPPQTKAAATTPPTESQPSTAAAEPVAEPASAASSAAVQPEVASAAAPSPENTNDHQATVATYAPDITSIASPAEEALAMVGQPIANSFPPPAAITSAEYQPTSANPQLNQPTQTSVYASGGYQPQPIAPASATEAIDDTAESLASSDSTSIGGELPKPSLAQQQASLITSLETEIRQRREAKADQAEIARLELQLRLLYLLAERPDDAVAAIDALSAPERESCKHLLFGLAAFMADEPASRAPHRNAKVLRALRDASSELAAGSRLDLRNMAFCEKVEYFGWYTEFPRYEFKPKQQVILYVEVENYAAESKGPQAFETELQGSYQIFDGSGQIIAERQLPLDREVCRNYRRDYFLAYRIYMPDSIAAGNYRLELTLEDLKARGQFQGKKLGQGTIDFSIR